MSRDGEIMIIVETMCPQCRQADSKPKCPKCGSHIIDGYGMMGGGMGFYELCSNDECDYFIKEQDASE